MANSALVETGTIETILAALCCFTPALIVQLSAVGLSAMAGYLDMFLLPALAIFVGITLFVLWKKTEA